MDKEFIYEHRALIAVAESCWRGVEPSYSWHVLDWMAFRLRCKYPPIMRGGWIISDHTTS